MLRSIVFTALLAFMTATSSEPIKATFIHNNSAQGQFPNDAISVLLQYILEQIPPEMLNAEFVSAALGRDWQLLQQQKNDCVYNKIKDAERSAIAVFSDRPVAIFPDNRLIVRKPNSLPENVDLGTIKQNRLLIGFESNRSFGEHIDLQLKQLDKYSYPVTGTDSHFRLIYLLFEKKIDGLIDYSASFYTNASLEAYNKYNVDNYSIHKIQGAPAFVYGYVACPKNATGKEIIALLNNAMKTTAVEEYMLALYKQAFRENEFSLLLPELQKQFNIQ